MSDRGNRTAAASPSLLRVVAATVAAVAVALAAISVPSLEVASEVTLVALPPPAMAEEERETELPASLGGGLHGSPLWSEPKTLGESAAGTESERPAAVHATEVVDILSNDEVDDMAEPPVSSRELAVVQSEAGPSGGLPEGDLEWPYPEDPAKVWFVLQDFWECQLCDILGEQGHATVSKLANLSAKLEDTQERVKSAQQLVEVDLQLTVEVSFMYLSLTSEFSIGCLSMFVFCRA